MGVGSLGTIRSALDRSRVRGALAGGFDDRIGCVAPSPLVAELCWRRTFKYQRMSNERPPHEVGTRSASAHQSLGIRRQNRQRSRNHSPRHLGGSLANRTDGITVSVMVVTPVRTRGPAVSHVGPAEPNVYNPANASLVSMGSEFARVELTVTPRVARPERLVLRR
jgi:hypothetical protein